MQNFSAESIGWRGEFFEPATSALLTPNPNLDPNLHRQRGLGLRLGLGLRNRGGEILLATPCDPRRYRYTPPSL